MQIEKNAKTVLLTHMVWVSHGLKTWSIILQIELSYI